ncbi:MAG: AtpZ/AtpI family protein [Actinomycetota bacterium]
MNPPERRGSSWSRAGVGFSQGWQILVELLAIIALFAFGGYQLDKWLGTKPWFFASLMIVGYAGGVLHVVIWVRKRTEDDERDVR